MNVVFLSPCSRTKWQKTILASQVGTNLNLQILSKHLGRTQGIYALPRTKQKCFVYDLVKKEADPHANELDPHFMLR